MNNLWKIFLKVLQTELKYLLKLRDNILQEQSILVLNQTNLLKDILKKQKQIMNKNSQLEQYRKKALDKLKRSGVIPASNISIKKLYQYVPAGLKKELKDIEQQMRVTVFEINEQNARNQLLLNNAVKIIDEELKLFTTGNENAIYHKNGELLQKQRLLSLNKRV